MAILSSPLAGLVVEPGMGAMAHEEKIGTVTKYLSRVSVAVIQLTDGDVRVGDHVRIRGATTELTQRVESLQVEHQNMNHVGRGSAVALKVRDRVRRNDQVFRVRRE
jgi:putative protease